ncbi:MAG: anhydro-N-acetylmuramic acid kinase [Hyphomicrobiales bacterium]
MKAIGLMSGTSMDGIDVAVIETDGEGDVATLGSLTVPFDDALGRLLWRSVEAAAGIGDRTARPEPLGEAESALTDAHAVAVRRLLEREGLEAADIEVVGFHGQTVLHRPEIGMTVQLGDGARLAALTGIDVVNDLRANDMASGGEGAPLAPVYHRALAGRVTPRPLAFLNVGGVANVTWIGADGPPVAFDTGPGNGLVDQWVKDHTGRLMDEGGAIAGAGTVSAKALETLLDHPYFDRPPPKSLDRFDFSLEPVRELSLEDGAATLVAFTAASVARAVRHLPAAPELWIVCGGGRRNPAVMAHLTEALDAQVQSAEQAGFDGDTIEAEAFAFMAVRSLKGLPLSFPTTTGVAEPVTGGVLHRA